MQFLFEIMEINDGINRTVVAFVACVCKKCKKREHNINSSGPPDIVEA